MKNSHKFFENRECRHFPCHKGIEPFNCLFCYCPLYHLENCPGNPEYKEKGEKSVKVCLNCTFPHNPDNYEKVLELLK